MPTIPPWIVVSIVIVAVATVIAVDGGRWGMNSTVVITMLALLCCGVAVAGVVLVVTAAVVGNVAYRLDIGNGAAGRCCSVWGFGVVVMGGERYAATKCERNGHPSKGQKVWEVVLVHDVVSKKSYVG